MVEFVAGPWLGELGWQIVLSAISAHLPCEAVSVFFRRHPTALSPVTFQTSTRGLQRPD